METTKESIQSQLIEFLCLQFMVEEEDIELDESLVDTGIIDSMGLIEIASYIEKKYAFKVTEEMMIRSNFGSVYKIVDFIRINNN
jgi:acyl carrier protein